MKKPAAKASAAGAFTLSNTARFGVECGFSYLPFCSHADALCLDKKHKVGDDRTEDAGAYLQCKRLLALPNVQ